MPTKKSEIRSQTVQTIKREFLNKLNQERPEEIITEAAFPRFKLREQDFLAMADILLGSIYNGSSLSAKHAGTHSRGRAVLRHDESTERFLQFVEDKSLKQMGLEIYEALHQQVEITAGPEKTIVNRLAESPVSGIDKSAMGPVR